MVNPQISSVWRSLLRRREMGQKKAQNLRSEGVLKKTSVGARKSPLNPKVKPAAYKPHMSTMYIYIYTYIYMYYSIYVTLISLNSYPILTASFWAQSTRF